MELELEYPPQKADTRSVLPMVICGRLEYTGQDGDGNMVIFISKHNQTALRNIIQSLREVVGVDVYIKIDEMWR